MEDWLSTCKSSNVSETGQDRTKVILLRTQAYGLSIGAKINDL